MERDVKYMYRVCTWQSDRSVLHVGDDIYLTNRINCEEARWDSVPKPGIHWHHMRKAHWQ